MLPACSRRVVPGWNWNEHLAGCESWRTSDTGLVAQATPSNPLLSTSPGMRQGNDHGSQYRSAIYPTSAEHMGAALRSKEDYQKVGPISLPGHLWGKSLVLGTWPWVPFACFGKFLSASWNRGLLPSRMETEMASMCSYACLLKSDHPDEYTTWHQISLSLSESLSLFFFFLY